MTPIPAMAARGFRVIPVTKLALDRDNPRLPERATDWSESDLIGFFRDECAIDEIIESMLANGFFTQEPLLVLETPDPQTGKYVVVEGNRRLASLLYIHGGGNEDYFDEAPSEEQIERLDEIPCVLVESRETVRTYLGFRHIGGIKDWSPEAKARFIRVEVDSMASQGNARPFFSVGKAYGSNSQGIRNSYIALTLLLHARDEYAIDVRYVQHQRFGVWQRLLNSASVRDYISFGKPTTYDEIRTAIQNVDSDKLEAIVRDLTPALGKAQALLNDSRQITEYGKVLTNARATEVLRTYEDLDAAIQIVGTQDLPARIAKIAAAMSALVDEVVDASWSEELDAAVGLAYRAVRKMRTEVTAKSGEAG